ncbi:MAG: hypothetical protein SGJ19_00935 [Planctomycetia bacterium]|nr:hypothetical protein [Planctomycetia bacterium]
MPTYSPPQIPSPARGGWGSLPSTFRVLHIAPEGRADAWLAEAFAADNAVDVKLTEIAGAAAGLEQLNVASFDAVLVTHLDGVQDALAIVEGIRGAGGDEALVILGAQPELEMAPLSFEVGADAYLSQRTTSTRGLLWTLTKAVERCRMVRENRRLSQLERSRLEREHHEAEHVLCEQRALVRDLESLHRRCEDGTEDSEAVTSASAELASRNTLPAAQNDLPAPLVAHYRELLRTHVIMGSGNLAEEMRLLAELLATAHISARQTLQLHLLALEELVRGLGARSTRHVLTRADLLVLEMMLYLAEEYRRRSGETAMSSQAA